MQRWLAVVAFICFSGATATTNAKHGWFGLYHPWNGTVWPGYGIPADQTVYEAFKFGIASIYTMPEYGGFKFEYDVKFHCYNAKVNALYGILAPPSEGGVVNNPNDTNIWVPAKKPGLIQSAHRWSVIATQCPQVFGIIIDDFYWNFPKHITLDDLKDIRGALMGKPINPQTGEVDHSAPATTPWLQLFTVYYTSQFPFSGVKTQVLPYIDGVSFWMFAQQTHYSKFDSYIKELQGWLPGKRILTGVYISNSGHHNISKSSIWDTTTDALALYKQGAIQHHIFFAGAFFTKKLISKAQWDYLQLPVLFEKDLWPGLKTGGAVVQSCSTHAPIPGAIATVEWKVGGKFNNVTRQATVSNGTAFWTGLEGTYRVTVSKPGFLSYTMTSSGPEVQQLCLDPHPK
eukprot:TRINITY_DN25593_c0_g1_i1.p1 TRINITY_DN25593_c0_g1~~TRINITY_DN25593_c0_g1_i1.p1  ORF type:complete len:413 (+),score=32.82 TRINITY_DN25593_c0_g1_i1:39-1241(+)